MDSQGLELVLYRGACPFGHEDAEWSALRKSEDGYVIMHFFLCSCRTWSFPRNFKDALEIFEYIKRRRAEKESTHRVVGEHDGFALIESGGEDSPKKCLKGHEGVTIRRLTGAGSRSPLKHWIQCVECGPSKLPETVEEAIALYNGG